MYNRKKCFDCRNLKHFSPHDFDPTRCRNCEIFLQIKRILERKCLYPFFVKGKNVYVHPNDAPEFWNDLRFISVARYRGTPKQREIGRIFGYSIFVQDDIQILLLAMKGDKSL